MLESQKIEMEGHHSVFLNGVEPVLNCFKFETKIEIINEIFDTSINKWDDHIKRVCQEREEVIKRTQ